MRRQRKKIVTVLVMMVLIIVVQGSMAYFTSSSTAINKFLLGAVDIEIEEKFDPNEEDDNKIVQIRNETKTDTLVRVSITPRWVEKLEDGTEVPFSGDVSSDVVTLNFSENLKDKPVGDFVVEDYLGKEYWVKGDYGFYYYLKILEADELTSILLKDVDIEAGLPKEYKGKTLTVDVKAEAVQATNHDIDNDEVNEYQFENVWFNVDENISNMLKEILNKK